MGLGFSLLVGPAVNLFSDSFLKNREFTGFSPVLIDTGSDLVVGIIRLLFLQVRNYSLVVIGMGLAVIITAAVLKSPSKKDPELEQGEKEPGEESIIPDPDGDENAQDEGKEEQIEGTDSLPEEEEIPETENGEETEDKNGSGSDSE